MSHSENRSPEELPFGGTSLAFHRSAGAGPGIMFVGGLRSDMEGGKALHLEAWARAEQRAYLRYDHYGHGRSGGRFEDGTMTLWRDGCLAMLDRVASGPQILVGSSMGGWVALLAAQARPAAVRGLVLVAPAPDFTEVLMWPRFDAAQRAALMRDGVVHRPSDYGDPYPISRGLIEDGRRHLLLGGPIDLRCPVRILQGMADPDVPFSHALRLAEAITRPDLQLLLIKDGDHRLSRPQDLDLLARETAALTSVTDRT